MFLNAALTVAGAILLGLAARRTEKNPLLILGGFALIVFSLGLHVFGDEGLVRSFGYASVELGAGFLVIAGMLSGKQEGARSYFILGAGAVALGIAVIVLRTALVGPNASILVELGPDDRYEEIQALVEEYGGEAERAFPEVDLSMDADLAQVYLIRIPDRYVDLLKELLRLDAENVDHVETNLTVSLDLPDSPVSELSASDVRILENDPLAASQWGLEAISGHQAHERLQSLTPVRKARVAILDTGIDSRHEDILSVYGGGSSADAHGHGTHCAGIAGAATNNGRGVASLNWEGRFVEILSFPALDASGLGSMETTAQAIIDAALAGVDVISMSLGATAEITPKTLTDAVAFARDRGAIVIAAAGNAGIDARQNVPANVDGVIVVGALDQNLAKARFSNTTEGLSRPIAAPGVDILSLRSTGGYVNMSGTSMATPMVSGLVGIMRAMNPEISDAEVFDILSRTGSDTRGSGKVGRLINADAALAAVTGS